MHLRTRTWSLISLLCFVAAAFFWQVAERKAARDQAERASQRPAPSSGSPVAAAASSTNGVAPAPTTNPSPAATQAVPPVDQNRNTNSAAVQKLPTALRHRLANTTKTVDQLSRSDTGLLLRNASIDSASPINLPIPAHLRAGEDPGSYVVQSRGPVTDRFRAILNQAGVQIVAYVPNNAFLVLATPAAAEQLGRSPQTQAVLPWEPYYKIDPTLMDVALAQGRLFSATRLNLLVFPGQRGAVLSALSTMGAVVLSEERSPFGHQLMVRPPENGLVALAHLPGVQDIEPAPRRVPANDLGRERVLVATNTTVLSNYRDLEGQGVLVGINDTYVDEAHVDLSPRVSGPGGGAQDGHGTHVAGTIASSGLNGPDGAQVPGSIAGANYRGMAPKASLFALPIDLRFGPPITDNYLQETAVATNAFIQNNSWGYGDTTTYTVNSANWDAAVRDALPGVMGSQPLIAVFSAGNSGASGVSAPGTAKNVITVGAIKNMRYITNEVVKAGETNMPWLSLTDTNNEVAAFSSLGNVSPGVEGGGGRFKPDLVAPGSFTVSTRMNGWVQPDGRITEIADQIEFVRIQRRTTNEYSIFVPDNATQLRIVTVRNSETDPAGLPALPIHIRAIVPPTAADFVADNDATVPTVGIAPATFNYSIGNPTSKEVFLHIRTFITVTNDVGNEPEVMDQLNNLVGPNYRFENGTSMAAPHVTGMIALMHEYYSKLGMTNSPALMKALLINGARTVNPVYDFGVTNAVNAQGWGLPNLTNSLPADGAVSDGFYSSATLAFFEQATNRALASGESVTRSVDIRSTAFPLRFTLVWTDPPGNPAVGIKLVNDLDLIVTNLDTGDVYIGNGISPGSTFNTPVLVDTNINPGVFTNALAGLDNVNNVENIFINGSIDERLSSRYSVTVVARRVNVNAVTAHPSGIVQDYAMVISSGEPRPTAFGFTVTDNPAVSYDPTPLVSVLTNGLPLLNQRVGANTPLLVSTNGVTNQWHFFVVTNSLPPTDPQFGIAGAATNIAFATFLPPNLSRPRNVDADIDLYVSENPALLNLDQAVLESAFKSLKRSGTESVVIPNANDGKTYYAGVKSEDQQSANFGFFAVSSSEPFSNTDTNGNVYLQGFPINMEIPDGSAATPQAGLVFAFCTEEITIQNVVVTNILTHENGGDLFGTLQHDAQYAVLNANRIFTNTVEFIYDDGDSGEIVESSETDFPGTLRAFVGEEGLGSWILTMVDSAPGYTGQVNRLYIKLAPTSEDLTNGNGIVRTILPGRFLYLPIDVPGDATNLNVCVAPQEGPLDVYIGRGFFPTQNAYDMFGSVQFPGSCISLGLRDSPPLSQGRYFIGIFNPNGTPVTANIKIMVERNLTGRSLVANRSQDGSGIFDDATTNNIIRVARSQLIADLDVGVRIEHERVSDLALHLVSPAGTRVLLAENRGGPFATSYGGGRLETNSVPSTSAGDANASTNIIGTARTEGTLQIDYNFLQVPDRMTVYYEGALIYDSGIISGFGSISVDFGPGNSTNVVVIMNEGGNDNFNTLWFYTGTIYTGYLMAVFTEDTAKAKLPIKFATPPFAGANTFITNVITNATVVLSGFEGGDPARSYVVPENVSGWDVLSGSVSTPNTSPAVPVGVPPYMRLAGAIATNFPTVIGYDYLVTFIYRAEARVAVAENLYAAAFDDQGGPLVELNLLAPYTPTNIAWSVTSFTFTATSPISTLAFEGIDTLSRPLIDDIRVQEVITRVSPAIYYLPEETLAAFRGENAFGDWKLEIWDSRAGGVSSNATLLAWRLNITYVNTNLPAILLTNGVDFCATLRTNETMFFRVEVPLSSQAVTNLITASGEVDLIYNQTGEPLGQQPPDTFFLNRVTSGQTILTTGGWASFDALGLIGGAPFPELQPGRRYYLAVRNRSRETNSFCIRATVDQLGQDLRAVTPLTNGCLSRAYATNGIEYFSFDVRTNSLGVRFSLSNILSGDLDLIVRRGLPLPTTNSFQAGSFNTGPTDSEFIAIDDFTGRLLPGRWYIGVVHKTGDLATYTVCAESVPGTVVPIVTEQLYPNSIAVGQVQYFQVNISRNAYQADFIVTNSTGNVDLYVARVPFQPLLQTPTNAVAGSAGPAFDEFIRLSAFDPTNALRAGIWYIAVVNRETVPVNYVLTVNQYFLDLDYVTLTNGVAYGAANTPASPAGLFQFDVDPNALQVVFEIYDASDDVDLYVQYDLPIPPPGPLFNAYSSTNGGTTNEFIAVLPTATNGIPAGTWYLAAVPKGPLPPQGISYKIRATQILSNEVVSLTNGVAYCSNIPPLDTNALYRGVQFYSFVVPPNGIQAMIETFGGNTNVDLYAQYGLPITNYSVLAGTYTNYPYASTNGDATNEFICVAAESAPLSLTNSGTWYIAVVNRDPVNADYCIRASVLSGTNVTALEDQVAVCDTIGVTNGSPLFGINYYSFIASPNATSLTFRVFNAMADWRPPFPIDVDIYLARDLCLTNYTFFDWTTTNYPYAGATPGPGDEFVQVTADTLPVPLDGGTWYLAVVNRSTNGASYCVQAVQQRSSIIELTNRVPYSATVLNASLTNAPIDYYLFVVSSNAVRAQFEILSPSANVNLVVRKGLPPPSFSQADYFSLNGGMSDELITVFTNSVPVPLSPGAWYLAVINTTGNPVSYTVKATEFYDTGLNILSSILVASSNQFCFTFTNLLEGANYFVQGRTDLTATNWFAVSPTIRPTTNWIVWCIDLPSPYQFFRLQDGLSPLSAGPAVVGGTVTSGVNGFSFTWFSTPGLRFGVEWTDGLFPPYWQPFPIPVTSLTGEYIFVDDGTLTGGFAPNRFYRIQVLQ